MLDNNEVKNQWAREKVSFRDLSASKTTKREGEDSRSQESQKKHPEAMSDCQKSEKNKNKQTNKQEKEWMNSSKK